MSDLARTVPCRVSVGRRVVEAMLETHQAPLPSELIPLDDDGSDHVAEYGDEGDERQEGADQGAQHLRLRVNVHGRQVSPRAKKNATDGLTSGMAVDTLLDHDDDAATATLTRIPSATT